jgi:hypothetical protein
VAGGVGGGGTPGSIPVCFLLFRPCKNPSKGWLGLMRVPLANLTLRYCRTCSWRSCQPI